MQYIDTLLEEQQGMFTRCSIDTLLEEQQGMFTRYSANTLLEMNIEKHASTYYSN